jgi:heme oxygenase
MAEHGHHHHGSAPTGFHRMLKEGTQKLHDQAESGNFQVRMVNGELARMEFASFLGQMHHIHETLDPALSAAAASDDRVASIFEEAHLRLGRVQQDLKDLESTEIADPLPATTKFLDYVKTMEASSPASLIGVLYVKEGATNGNKFVAKKLRDTMELGPDMAMGYLDPHGKEQRKRWNAFKETLNELNLTEDEQNDCVAVAQETFQMVMDISKQIPVVHEPATAQA